MAGRLKDAPQIILEHLGFLALLVGEQMQVNAFGYADVRMA